MNPRTRAVLALVGSVVLAAAYAPPPLHAQAAAAGAAPAGAIEVPFDTFSLGNGLRVVLAQDRSTPVVAVDVWYDVGSKDERVTRTGFAHLFEHMMFQGSANVRKGEHLQLVERAGGSMNGSTHADYTNYFETLPSNRLNLGLWLEADRMRSLAVTQENLKNQIEVVKEERRLRFDNAPYALSFLTATSEALYGPGCFAYQHPGIGSMEDLNAAKLEDVQQFFRTYYAPNNATLVVVGDFDPGQAKQLIEQYFGAIPRQPAPPVFTCDSAFAGLPKTQVVDDHSARLPAVLATYGLPPAGSPDMPALELLSTILGDGESSRLNQRLVKQEKAALQTGSIFDRREGPSLIVLLAIANQGATPEKLQSLIDDEVARVRKSGVSADELKKAQNQYRSSTVRGLQTALGRAERLHYFDTYMGDPARIRTDLARYLAVTPADIQRVAEKYLAPNNRAVVVTRPVSAPADGKE